MTENNIKKIAHFISPVKKGGGEILIADLVSKQSLDIKNELTLILGANNEYMENKLKKHDVKILKLHCLNSDFSYSIFQTLFRSSIQYIWLSFLFIFYDFNVFHSHSFPGQYLVLPKILNIFKYIPTIFIHTKHIDSKRNTLKSLLWKIALKLNNHLTFVSKSARNNAFVNLNSKKISIISNPVEEIFFKNGDQRIKKIDDRRGSNKNLGIIYNPKICIISRLVKGKGHIELIEYMANLLSKNDEFLKLKLFILGDGPLRNNITELINYYKLEKNIQMLGLVEQEKVIAIINECDFAIHPSTNEGLSISCLQYLASCLPTLPKKYGPSYDVFGANTLYYKDYLSFEKSFLQLTHINKLHSISKNFHKVRHKAKWNKVLDLYASIYKN